MLTQLDYSDFWYVLFRDNNQTSCMFLNENIHSLATVLGTLIRVIIHAIIQKHYTQGPDLQVTFTSIVRMGKKKISF